MAMGPWVTIAAALSGLNALLLLALCVVWLRNHRTFRSNLVLGLLAFAAVMLLENLVALSFYFSMGMLYAGSPRAGQTVVALRGLQFVALVFLTHVTMK
jgi:multisubunit Na+/H+ antiporter MnhF subunit